MADPLRIKLPHRRLTVTDTIEWGRNTWLLSVGFAWGLVREVFVNGIKIGTDADAWAVDSCILLSRLLQSGWEPAALLGSLSPMPDQASGATPSLMAVILRKAIEIQEQEGDAMRLTQAAAAALDPWRKKERAP
jgi:hypothetical protein